MSQRASDDAKPRIAFVGAGPTAIYSFNALVRDVAMPCAITLFEEQPVAGLGTPYRPGWNDPAMLSNIASVEIPQLASETLVAWLERQTPQRLAEFGIARNEIDERAFYPRVVLGAYFKEQFDTIVGRARNQGHVVHVRTRCRVVDAVLEGEMITLSTRSPRLAATRETFDYLVIATGHQWPEDPEAHPGYFLSPWPASALARIPACHIGIRGSSLTAIDATVALATKHGAFVERGSRLEYVPAPDTDAFHVTMMSRKGLLPEADYYHPVPYLPLEHCTASAIAELASGPTEGLLDRAFGLFKEELTAADPAYARERSLARLTVESFCESYFDRRRDVDPFVWAEANLQEAESGYADHRTVAWRYAILRMHEVIGLVVPHLDDDDFTRFTRYFKPVFVDDYATVPHESIKRLLALHAAGKLDLRKLGERHRVETHGVQNGVVVNVHGERTHFPVFIEATGQRSLPARDFPFPSLVTQGIVRDEPSSDSKGAGRGVAVDDRFHPVVEGSAVDRLFCVSLPFLLGRHPFVQGITSSHEMGSVVGEALAKAVAKRSGPASKVVTTR